MKAPTQAGQTSGLPVPGTSGSRLSVSRCQVVQSRSIRANQHCGLRSKPQLADQRSAPRCSPRVLSACWILILLATNACRRDMFEQPYSKPLEPSRFFADNHMASRPEVPYTVARGELQADTEFYTAKIGTNLVTTLPFPVTKEVLLRGRERFNIYCSPCHDRAGTGHGMIVQRGFPAPPSYHIDRLRAAPVGHFFDVITHGYGVMYPYAARVEPRDRWAIAAYIRVLQASRDARLKDVPATDRAQLEQTP
jgi:Cytochrome C oxidase, cbb3-type, subunit III